MPPSDDSLKHVSPDDALPEVVAPSASFLVPLFVVPFCIVTIIVMVWLAFHWVALKGTDAASDIEQLSRNNDARWQAAANFADRLRNPRNAALRRDSESARKVAAILQGELEQDLAGDGDSVQHAVNFRLYLCRALGEFEVADGLPVLLDAAAGKGAGATHEQENLPVRRAAMAGLSVLISNVRSRGDTPADDPFEGVLPVLSAAAGQRELGAAGPDEVASLRYTAAFALGVLGGADALDQLVQLLIDANPDVRYNAACGLARHGDARAEIILVEMLDPAVDTGVRTEQAAAARPLKRASIYHAALQATKKLLDANQADPLHDLQAAVRQLIDENQLEKPVRLQATEVLNRFENRTVTTAAGL
jgi:hypothetical protein